MTLSGGRLWCVATIISGNLVGIIVNYAEAFQHHVSGFAFIMHRRLRATVSLFCLLYMISWLSSSWQSTVFTSGRPLRMVVSRREQTMYKLSWIRWMSFNARCENWEPTDSFSLIMVTRVQEIPGMIRFLCYFWIDGELKQWCGKKPSEVLFKWRSLLQLSVENYCVPLPRSPRIYYLLCRVSV